MIDISPTAEKVLATAGVSPEDAAEALGVQDGDRITVAMAKRHVEGLKEEAPEPAGEEPREEAPEPAEEDPVDEPAGMYSRADPSPDVRAAIVRRVLKEGLQPTILAWRTVVTDRGRAVFFLTPDGKELSAVVRS